MCMARILPAGTSTTSHPTVFQYHTCFPHVFCQVLLSPCGNLTHQNGGSNSLPQDSITLTPFSDTSAVSAWLRVPFPFSDSTLTRSPSVVSSTFVTTHTIV